MPQDKPLVIATRRLPASIEARLGELFDARLNTDDHAMSEAELKAAVAEADILVPTVTDRLNAEVLAAAGPKLKMIANFGVGVDHIDLKAAAARGLKVSNTPGVLTDDTADITLILMLNAMRRSTEGERLLRAGKWPGWSPTWHLGQAVRGKALGIIGMGRIGRAVAERAKAFGMDIHYHNRSRLPQEQEKALEATYWADVEAMLPKMNVVSVNCPRTPETVDMLSRQRIATLRPDCVVVNTARGGVIDEEALADALAEGRIAGAGLDVYDNEPRVNPRLIALENVVLAPHMGSSTIEARTAMGEKVIINIKTFIDGHTPPDSVFDDD
jgi:glyoxylate reductase